MVLQECGAGGPRCSTQSRHHVLPWPRGTPGLYRSPQVAQPRGLAVSLVGGREARSRYQESRYRGEEDDPVVDRGGAKARPGVEAEAPMFLNCGAPFAIDVRSGYY